MSITKISCEECGRHFDYGIRSDQRAVLTRCPFCGHEIVRHLGRGAETRFASSGSSSHRNECREGTEMMMPDPVLHRGG